MFPFLKSKSAVCFSAAVIMLGSLAVESFAQMPAAASSAANDVEKQITEIISSAAIKESTAVLSSVEMQGRATLQPGGDRAAVWLADRFQRFGLKPLGDKGSYLQKVPFKEVVATAETAFLVDGQPLTFGTDYGFVPMNSGDKTAAGDMVFVGYGIVSKELKRDDLGGIDVAGKVVVLLPGPPAGVTKASWDKVRARFAILRNLIMAGAAAIVYVGNGTDDQNADEMVNYISRRQIIEPDETGYPPQVPPILYVSASGAEKLFAKSGTTAKQAVAAAESTAFRAVKLNVKAKLAAKYKTTSGNAANVVGYIEGSDPALKQEAVLFTAHYDGYGSENGKIYPGAADNALGTSELLAVAEAFSKLKEKPKRSLVFLAVTGEEYGLYGSKYWAKNPTWNIKKVAADLNLDGIGSEVYGPVKTIVGYGAEYSTLGKMLSDVAAPLGIDVIADPMPDQKVFYRSDHYSFVERGVPSLMLLGAPAGAKEVWLKRIKDWEKTDYHQPTDVVKPDWAWQGPETVAEVMAVLGWRIANDPSMPSWIASERFGKLQRGNNDKLPEDE